MLLNILHLSKTNSAVTDIYATSCFDCITPSFIYLVYAKAGTKITEISLVGKSLLQSKYYPTTTHGVSRKGNSHSLKSPFWGICQGLYDRTAARVHTCDTFIKVHKRRSKDLRISNPTTENTTDSTINTFMDDIKLFNVDQEKSKTKVIQTNIRDA